MIEKFCTYLTKKIREKMPEIDDERADVINYGLQNIVGEFPKIIIVIILGFLLGIGKLTLLNFIILGVYRSFAGGVHAKSHIGCIVSTSLMFCLPPVLSKLFVMDNLFKFLIIIAVWVFGVIMIKLYAPADTENVPILRKKERKQKQILSYVVLTIELIIAAFINNSVISNMIIISMFLETITITRVTYKLFDNKYGYEVYNES